MRYVPQLDGVRAVAVTIVILSHAGLGKIIPGGFGVTMFFFLSGYLITSLLRSEAGYTGAVDLKAFYVRRCLRIMPPLYITLIVLTALNLTGIFGDRVRPDAIPWDYLFLSNYSHMWGQEGGLPIPLWSLAVEEHFYLLFPLAFMLFLMGKAPKRAARLCLAACAFILLLRFGTLLLEPEQLYRNYYWSHTRMDSILFGCCLALWQNPVMDGKAWRPKHWHAALAFAAILMTFVIKNEIFRETARYSIQGAALFVLFSYTLFGTSAALTKALTWAPVVWIGKISYALYLCHFSILTALARLPWNPVLAACIGIALSVLYAWAMRVAVEKPILEWRRRRPKTLDSLATISDRTPEVVSIP